MAKTKELKELIAGKFEAKRAALRKEHEQIIEAAWAQSEACQEGKRIKSWLEAYNAEGFGEIEYERYGREKWQLTRGDKFKAEDLRLEVIQQQIEKIAVLAEEAELALALAKAPTLDATVRELLAKLAGI